MSRQLELLIPAAALALAVGSGCGPGEQPRPAVDAFSVVITSIQVQGSAGQWVDHWPDPANPGAPPAELPFATTTRIGVQITPTAGAAGFDGYVSVQSVPGEVVALDSQGSEVLRTSVRVSQGVPANVNVEIVGAFGETRIWVEDVGLQPVNDPVGAACDDGVDNDGDGLADFPLDPGCFMRNDASEGSGSHSVGVSEEIVFANPRLGDTQGCGPVPTLQRQVVTVDRGSLYVTAVETDGFYVTDFASLAGGCDPSSPCCVGGRYAHMFAYNFNTPYGMRVCDRLQWVAGTVADFYGFTEMNFPSWRMYDIDQDPNNGLTLMRASPTELTPELCPVTAHPLTDEEIFNSSVMESWEAGLVEVVDAAIPAPEDWVDCDLNDDSEVAFRPDMDVCVPRNETRLQAPYCTTQDVCCELECNDACNGRLCAELSTYYRYGQFPLQVGTARLLMTADAVPEFNPRELARAGQTQISRVSGVMREFAPLDFPWIIQPRCRQDIHLAGDGRFVDVPVYRRCVPSEETGDYEDPY